MLTFRLLIVFFFAALFKGQSGGCAYAKPNTILNIEDGAIPIDYYKILYQRLGKISNAVSRGAIVVGDENVALETKSNGVVNIGSKIDNFDNLYDEIGSDDNGPGAFSVRTHNTFQTSESNITVNMGSWVTHGNNTYNGGSS